MTTLETTRAPRQKRSQQRVERILDAAKELIAIHGCAGLKIQDIAATADITAGSIYQYFPNKAAIIQALGELYLDQIAEMIAGHVQDMPTSPVELFDQLELSFEASYAVHRADPVIRDIWMGAHSDKTLKDMDEADTARNVEAIFAQAGHLYAPDEHDRLRQVLELMMAFAAAAIRVAVTQDPDEGQATIDLSKTMLRPAFMAVMERG